MRVNSTPKAIAAGIAVLTLLVLAALGRGGPPVAIAAIFLSIIIGLAHAQAQRMGYELYRIRVARRAPERLGEGTEDTVYLILEYTGNRPPSYVEVEDHPDERLRASGARKRTFVARKSVVSYKIRPAPGASKIRGVTLRTGDPLGLFIAERHVPLKNWVSATPAWLPLYTGPRSTRLGNEESLLARRKGASPEFYQLREYQYGDDVRLIHWPTTARTGKLMVREGLENVTDNVALLIDLSAPTWPGTPGEAPADWIMRTSLHIARTVLQAGGTVWAYILRGEFWEEWPLLQGREAVYFLANRLSVLGPDTAERKMGLEQALQKLSQSTPAGTRLIILMGPGISFRSVANALAESRRVGCGVYAGLFLPTGDSMVERAIRSAETLIYRHGKKSFDEIGVRLFLLSSPGEVAWFAESVSRAVRPGSC